MNVFLLYPEKEWVHPVTYFDKEEIVQDLNLTVLFRTAGSILLEETKERPHGGSERDNFVVDTMKKVMLVPLADEREVKYRQGLVREAIENYSLMSALYSTSCAAAAELERFAAVKKEKWYRNGDNDKNRLLMTELEYLTRQVHYLDELRTLLLAKQTEMKSEGLRQFAARFLGEYTEEYARTLSEIIRDLGFASEGGLIELSARLGEGLEMADIMICRIKEKEEEKGFGKKMTGKLEILARNLLFSGTHVESMENLNLLQEVAMLRNTALSSVMKFFLPFLEEKEEFFNQLHFQLAFYIGAANLCRQMQRFHVPMCYPEVTAREDLWLEDLVELSLALYNQNLPVGNRLDARGKYLVVVTGANQGGKSTFLRSLGIAQIMHQCGMFVAAAGFGAGLYRNVFTHFTRREDSAMNSGRLDEELGRMERIMDHMTEDSVLYLNESFATTTEKEGSVIAADISKALYERKIRVMMVTHLLAFARECYAGHPEHAVFLAAERKEDGRRTFHIIETAPEQTSYGLDLYDELELGKNDEENPAGSEKT